MRMFMQRLVGLASRLKLIPMSVQVVKELWDDVEAGETIVISERRRDGPKLRDRRPFVALGALAALRICHRTIYNTGEPDDTHVIAPEAFRRSSDALPRSATVWRYQDHWKFRDLLETETLHLSGMEFLDDPLEGRPTKNLLEMIDTVEHPKPLIVRILVGKGSLLDHYEAFLKECCVNCWHMEDEESIRFWKLCKTSKAVAVRTNIGDLIDAVAHDRNAKVRKVHYLDYEPDGAGKSDGILAYEVENLASHKDKEYSYEKEVRIIHHDPGNMGKRIIGKTHNDVPARANAHIRVSLIPS